VTMSDKDTPLPVATPMEAGAAVEAVVTSAVPTTAAAPAFVFGSASSPETEGKAAREDDEEVGLAEGASSADLIAKYGTVEEQEAHIDMLGIKLQ